MSDAPEDEDERLLRRVGRRMKIQPEGLLARLKPLGFMLLQAARGQGSNKIEYLRSTPGAPGFFDIVQLQADDDGCKLICVYLTQGIVSHATPCTGVRSWIPASRLGYDYDHPKIRTIAQAIEVEQRLVQVIPELSKELFEREGRAFYESTASARDAANRYLTTLQPSADLQETFTRLRATATERQWQQSFDYIRRESLLPFNLVKFRPVWEIAGLCQVLYWERPDASYRAFRDIGHWSRATADEREAHWRLQLVASRLARAPGWPVVDPLVPNRRDLEETIPWRDDKPTNVAELFDGYLAVSDQRCSCGKCLYYVRHTVLEHEPRTAAVLARCNNGHEETIELAAAGLGTLP